MGVQNPPSPLLYGPNSKATNAQQGEVLPNGTYVGFNGPKNYVSYGNFANGLATGWSAVGIATVTNGLPITVGSSGAAFTSANGGRAAGGTTTAPAVTSTGALTNGFSFNLATSGAGTIGDGYISQAYAVDAEDLGKVLNISLSYKVASGTPVMAGTSANTYALAIYDLFNNAWIYPAGAFNFIQVTGTGSFTGTFQTPINMTSFQVFIYSPVAPTAASSLLLNSIVVGPQKQVNGPAMSDWLAYTPTFTGFGAATGVNFFSRRVGDSLEVKGFFTSGITTAVPNQITIGYNGVSANVSVDITKVGGGQLVGGGGTTSTGTTAFTWNVLGPLTTANYVQMGYQSSTQYSVANGQNANALNVINGTSIEVYFSVPIVGWSSNSNMSADTDTRVVACQVSSTSTQSIGSASYVQVTGFGTPSTDTAGSWSGNSYTVPVSGVYKVTFKNYWANTSLTGAGNIQSLIQVNGSAVFTALNPAGPASSVQYRSGLADAILSLTAGQVLTFVVYQDSGTTLALNGVGNAISVSINRQSGPAVIAATESVNARYFSSSTTVSGSLATVLYSTKGWDSHSAYNVGTGQYIVPVSGRYQVNASIAMTGTFVLNSTLDLQVQQTGSRTQTSESKAFSGGAVTQMNTNVGDIFWCNAGDIIQVQTSNTGTTPVIAATTTQNWISIARAGN